MRIIILTSCLLLLASAFWVWSFTLTDPNLLYSSHPIYVELQQSLIQTDRQIITWIYIVLTALSFGLYFYVAKNRENLNSIFKKKTVLLFFALLPLTFVLVSNNALSHDIYNYMFNAKAVVWYQKDPHVRSALEIKPEDDWLRFMHNVHTPAPYGKTWTTLSLIPYTLGGGKFLSTFLAFKVFMLLGLLILFYLQRKFALRTHDDHWKEASILLFLNPLVLIETLMNGHNDIWMMAFAFASLVVMTYAKRLLSWQTLLSLVLLLISAQVKLGTNLIFPIWFVLLFWHSGWTKSFAKPLRSTLKWIAMYWADISALLIFLPLFTDRSQQFHPWYLIWPLTFLPFMKNRLLEILLVTFSLTSLLRYVPFLLEGGYSDTIQFQMRLITWSAIPIVIIIMMAFKVKDKR